MKTAAQHNAAAGIGEVWCTGIGGPIPPDADESVVHHGDLLCGGPGFTSRDIDEINCAPCLRALIKGWDK